MAKFQKQRTFIMKNTTIYTCCNKKYEHFIPIFVHSILYHNNDVDVEIGIEDDFLSEYVENVWI